MAVDLAGGDVTGQDKSGGDGGSPPRPRGGRMRRIVAGVLVALFVILVPITTTIAWVHRTVMDTDTYVSTVAPVAADPRVIAAVSRDVTNQLYSALDVPDRIAEVLPPKAALLSVPIANGARGYVQEAVAKVLASDQFQQLWEQSNRFAHAQVVAVLRGDTTVLEATGGQVSLNLVPLLNAALQSMSSFVAGIVGHTVSLPPLTGQELPSVACARVSEALDRPLPSTCGVIPLFRAQNLEAAQRAVRAFDRGTVLLLIVTPLLAALALVLSHRRRRTLLQLSIGAAAGLVVVRRVVMWSQDELIAVGRPENKGARTAIVDQVLGGFFDITLWLVIAALLVTVVALVTGPYRWAVRTRAVAGQAVGAVRAAFAGRGDGRSDEAVAWAVAHFNAMQFGAIGVAVLIVAAFDVNFLGLLIIAAVVGLFVLGLHRLRTASGSALPVAPVQRSGDTHPLT